MKYSVLTFFCLWLCFMGKVYSQPVYCPPNIDFEQGNFNNWVLYAGTCCPIATTTTAALPNRHTITSGTGVDLYGGFPVVAPGVGIYSLKLGNAIAGAQAERARYYVHVPAGINNYSLIFRYAVVFEDPGHTAAEQPRFEVKGYDSTTGLAIPCAQFTFVASSALPGFKNSPIPGPGQGNPVVRYKAWSTASINLSGYAGKTVAVDFASGDCDLTGHFGYGYVDVNCALFQISTSNCSNSATTTLTAPPGFFKYEWRDSSLATLIDTLQSITIATPPITTKYAVILKPYPGFGCPDTLFTYLKIFHLNTTLSTDTLICKNDTAKIISSANGSAPPFTYTWSPSTNLSCTNCSNPLATPPASTSYVMTVTDENGCTKRDTMTVNVDNLQATLAGVDVSCFGFNNGSISSNVSGGILPYTYSWNTTPAAVTSGISNLDPGIYTVLIKDGLGCKIPLADTITQPPLLKDTIVHADVLCNGGTNAAATVTVSGGTTPYSYNWNTVPVQTANVLSAVGAGSYILTVTDANNCIRRDTAVITEPAVLNATITTHKNVSCNSGANGESGITATGGTPPYTYSWNTTPVKTTATATALPAGIYIVTITDDNGCVKQLADTITQPPVLTATIAKTDATCYDSANATAVVNVNGGSPPYKYAWNTTPVQTVAVLNGLAAGSYTVNITDTLQCTTTASATINRPTALVRLTNTTDVSCNGGNNATASIAVSGGTTPYSYAWNTLPVQTAASLSSLTAGTYIVTTTDGQNCTKKDTLTVTEPALLHTALTTTNPGCFGGNNGSATVIATGGTSPYGYNWNTTPLQTTAAAQNLGNGTYIITVTDKNGCIKADTAIISQPGALTATVSKTDANCFGESNGTASVSVSGGTTPYSYSWNTTPTQSAASAGNLAAGTYTVTVTDKENCMVTASASIGQPSQLILTPAHVDASCFDYTNGSASIATSGGTTPYSISWNTTPVQTTPSINNLSAGNYIATVKDSHQCIANTTIAVGQPAGLQTTASHLDVDCFGGTTGNAGVSVAGGTMPYTYLWNTTPVQSTAQAVNLGAGTYIVAITDANGCTQKDTALVQEPSLLTATTTVKGLSCYLAEDGTATVATAGGTVPYTYVWNTQPPQTGITATALTAGKYTVTVTDAKGCKATVTTESLHQPDEIKVWASALDKTCMWTANGKGQIDSVKGAINPYTFVWNTTPPQYGDTVYNLASGTYIVTVVDSNNCNGKANITIENYPQPEVYAGDDVTICPGTSVQLTASGAVKYTWSPVVNLSCITCVSPVATPVQSSLYIVTGTDANNCSDTDEVMVTIAEKQGGEVGPGLKICRGDSVQLHAAGGISYLWTPGAGMGDNTTANPWAAVDNNTTFTVLIKENECFTDTLLQRVQVFERPSVELGPDLSGIPGSTLPLHADVTNATGIAWTPVTDLSCTDCYDPVASLSKTITYTAYVNNDSICFAEDNITIRVACDGSFLFIPNTFTPNGDGRNDYFYASAHGLNTINLMRVYNRWGEKVFEARNIAPGIETNGWDGRYKNAELSPDVYVYYFEVNCTNGEVIFLKGDISLIR